MSYCYLTDTFCDYTLDPRYICYEDFEVWYGYNIAKGYPEEVDLLDGDYDDIYLNAMYHWCDKNNIVIKDEGVFNYNIRLDEYGKVTQDSLKKAKMWTKIQVHQGILRFAKTIRFFTLGVKFFTLKMKKGIDTIFFLKNVEYSTTLIYWFGKYVAL